MKVVVGIEPSKDQVPLSMFKFETYRKRSRQRLDNENSKDPVMENEQERVLTVQHINKVEN